MVERELSSLPFACGLPAPPGRSTREPGPRGRHGPQEAAPRPAANGHPHSPRHRLLCLAFPDHTLACTAENGNFRKKEGGVVRRCCVPSPGKQRWRCLFPARLVLRSLSLSPSGWTAPYTLKQAACVFTVPPSVATEAVPSSAPPPPAWVGPAQSSLPFAFHSLFLAAL